MRRVDRDHRQVAIALPIRDGAREADDLGAREGRHRALRLLDQLGERHGIVDAMPPPLGLEELSHGLDLVRHDVTHLHRAHAAHTNLTSAKHSANR